MSVMQWERVAGGYDVCYGWAGYWGAIVQAVVNGEPGWYAAVYANESVHAEHRFDTHEEARRWVEVTVRMSQ